MIGPLVFVHEMGHYLAGRFFGIKADAFAIGFGH
ncbi:site-2 protease family protein, partial [Pseudomonas aeruginosa]